MADESTTDAGDSRRRLYRKYVSTHVRPAGIDGRYRIYRPVLNGLPPDRDARILDLGCGAGDLVADIAGRGYRNIAGVDISEEQVARAHELGRSQVEQGNVFDYLSDRIESFDAITASDVLEHFDRDEVLDLLDRIFLALRPGGVFVAQAPNATSPFFGNYAFGDFTHRSVFTQRSVQQICSAAGFVEVAVHPVSPLLHGVVSTIRRGIWMVFAGVAKLALAAETGGLRGNVVTQNLWFVAVKR